MQQQNHFGDFVTATTSRRDYYRKWLAANGPAVQRRREQQKARAALAEVKAAARARQKLYYAKNREKLLAQVRQKRRKQRLVMGRQEATPDERNKRHIYQYGIDLAERDRLFEGQGGCCAVCRSPSPGSKYGWHLDHCHKTKKVRGVLCMSCNTILGKAKDSVPFLQALIQYLERP